MKPEQSVVVFTGIGYIEIHFWQLRGHDTHQAHIKQKATELLVVFTGRARYAVRRQFRLCGHCNRCQQQGKRQYQLFHIRRFYKRKDRKYLPIIHSWKKFPFPANPKKNESLFHFLYLCNFYPKLIVNFATFKSN